MLDEKGKIFGRINFIDFALICFALSWLGIGLMWGWYSVTGRERIIADRKIGTIFNEFKSKVEHEIIAMNNDIANRDAGYKKGFEDAILLKGKIHLK